MNWIERMNMAVSYLETNMQGEIDYAEVAKIAYCSVYHFQRLFSCIAGVSLTEYIRRRRMTLAAVDLQGGEKVLDVALKYGYNSPTAFNRAFQSIHGIAPSLVKADGVTLKSFMPVSFKITVKGVEEMNFRIEKKGELRIVGVKITTTITDGQNFRDITAFWEQCLKSGLGKKIATLIGNKAFGENMCGVLGVCVMHGEGSSEFDYYIAAVTDAPVPEGMEECTVPAAQYVVFEAVGALPDSVQQLTQKIYSEWLPTSGYEYGNGSDIEVYSDGDITAADYKSEVWVPVVKKG